MKGISIVSWVEDEELFESPKSVDDRVLKPRGLYSKGDETLQSGLGVLSKSMMAMALAARALLYSSGSSRRTWHLGLLPLIVIILPVKLEF